MKFQNILSAVTAVLLTGIAVSSCSDNTLLPDPPEGGPDGKVRVILSTDVFGAGGTRAGVFNSEELAQSPPTRDELINSYEVAFVRDNEVVELIRDIVNGSGVWSDTVTTELPRGTYTILAVANDYFSFLGMKDIKKGATLPSDWKNRAFNPDVPEYYEYVSMSGYLEDQEIRGTVNETFAIELVRMNAKVEYALKNKSQQAVKINSFTLAPVYDGEIYVFPRYTGIPIPDSEPQRRPSFPVATTGKYDEFIHYPIEEISIPAGDTEVQRGTFYIKESIAQGNHPTDCFRIGLDMTRGGVTEDVWALADEKLAYICRNDYILFPIVISDYTPEIEVFDYPPIGGYPVNVESKGTEFYATFSSSGDFDIAAKLRDSQGRTVQVEPYDSKKIQQSYVRVVEKSPGLSFTYDSSMDAWRGYYEYVSGSALRLEVTFEFKIDNLIYTRKLYLLGK